jgi:hypothetical protein
MSARLTNGWDTLSDNVQVRCDTNASQENQQLLIADFLDLHLYHIALERYLTVTSTDDMNRYRSSTEVSTICLPKLIIRIELAHEFACLFRGSNQHKTNFKIKRGE